MGGRKGYSIVSSYKHYNYVSYKPDYILSYKPDYNYISYRRYDYVINQGVTTIV